MSLYVDVSLCVCMHVYKCGYFSAYMCRPFCVCTCFCTCMHIGLCFLCVHTFLCMYLRVGMSEYVGNRDSVNLFYNNACIFVVFVLFFGVFLSV